MNENEFDEDEEEMSDEQDIESKLSYFGLFEKSFHEVSILQSNCLPVFLNWL